MDIRSGIKTITFFVMMIISQIANAQCDGIVLDAETNKPIPYVNIYTTFNKDVLGTTSNSQGLFNVQFFFNRLTFSHVNYEKRELLREDLTDTIYLEPSSNILSDIFISNKQPEWIKDVLERFVSQRKKKYCTSERLFSYKYDTRTLSDSNGYAFKSEGSILIPQIQSGKSYRIASANNVIHYKNNTAGVDFSNLQRILYEDILLDIDSKFIRSHEFNQNYAYKASDQNIVQLVFNAKDGRSDSGFLVIDTVSATILEIERNTGTDINIQKQTSSALRAIASEKGFNYDEWVVYNYARYENFDKSLYPVDCMYKLFMKSSVRNKKRNDSYFVSSESKLSLSDTTSEKISGLIDIPRPYYMLFIKSKQMRLDEEKLNRIPVTFDHF